jgi:hypothetical protein
MIVDLSLWDLDGGPAVDALQAAIAVDEWERVEGLRLKLWIADRANRRWGAIMLWDHERPPSAALPPNRAAELIGRPADHRMRFEVEAAT